MVKANERAMIEKVSLFSHLNEPTLNLHFHFIVDKYLFMFEVKRSKEGRKISKFMWKFMWIRRQRYCT
jgi:hypothetical protein